MEIRSATVEDVGHIVPLIGKIAALHEGWDSAKFGYRADAPEMYRGWLGKIVSDPKAVILVAEHDGKLAAFLLATAEEDLPIYRVRDFGFIHDIWVEPEYRHEGVGRQIVMLAIERFRQMGMAQVRADTAVVNDAARNLLGRCGMRPSITEMLVEL